MNKFYTEQEIYNMLELKQDKRHMIKKLFEDFTRDIKPELIKLKNDSCNKKNNIYQLANAYKLSAANAITRTYSTKLGLLWEKIADLAPNVISPELDLGYKIPEVDIIVLYDNKLYYTQLKTQKNTLTGSQTKRTIDELSKFQNHWFVACINTNCSSTIPKSLNKLIGKEFWEKIGINYDKDIEENLIMSIKEIEKNFYNIFYILYGRYNVMEFCSVIIKNFRNFEDISINLTNKNVLFGMNDVGKTNFLYALRFIFDKDIRRQNFIDTDYYKKTVNKPIEIIVAIDISDTDNNDSQKLRAKLKGALLSNQNIVYIKVKADYNKKEMIGIPVLYWGGDLDDLEEMNIHGTFFDIDYVFNVIYIDAYVDLYALFRKNVNKLLINDSEKDKEKLDEIQNTCDMLNKQIANLSGVKAFEEKISPECKKFGQNDVSVSVKSEIAIKGVYSNIVPYIKQDEESLLYPTSGEGRKKLLVYTIWEILSREDEEKN